MKREKHRRRELEKLLARGETPEPPAGLAARIKQEIPERLPAVEQPGRPRPAGPGRPLRPWLLAAASVAVMLAGGLLAYRTVRQVPLAPEARQAARETAGTVETLAAPRDEAARERRREAPAAAMSDERAAQAVPAAPRRTPQAGEEEMREVPEAGAGGEGPGREAEARRQAAGGVEERRQETELPIETAGAWDEMAVAEVGKQFEVTSRPSERHEVEGDRPDRPDHDEPAAGARRQPPPPREPQASPAPGAEASPPAESPASEEEPAARPRPESRASARPPDERAGSEGERAVEEVVVESGEAPPARVMAERRQVPAASPAAPELRRLEETAGQTLAAAAAPGTGKARLADAAGAGLREVERFLAAGRLPPPDTVQAADLAATLGPEVNPPPPPGGATFLAQGVRPESAEASPVRLRFAVALGAGVPASEASVRVELERWAVAGWRRLGETELSSTGRPLRLPLDTSGRASALVEVELRPQSAPEAVVATLILRYPSDGRRDRVEERRELRLDELARSRDDASPALRHALLAAELGETLQDPRSRRHDLEDLARRAAELAAERPGDPRAATLARLAARAAELVRGEG